MCIADMTPVLRTRGNDRGKVDGLFEKSDRLLNGIGGRSQVGRDQPCICSAALREVAYPARSSTGASNRGRSRAAGLIQSGLQGYFTTIALTR